MEWNRNRTILLAVTGGIAAYKTPALVRALAPDQNRLVPLMTEAAEAFVSPLVLGTLSREHVWRQRDYLEPGSGRTIPHITLAEEAEVLAVAPCTAATLSRLAAGEAATLTGSVALATRAPVVLFPAMNVHMWEHPATQANAARCAELGYTVVRPESGALACGDSAPGRFPAVETVAHHIWRALSPRKDLQGVRVLVTAGPTREFLDPVRYIGNPSSGRMGLALALTAWYRGAHVEVVHGPLSVELPAMVESVPVTSALEMRDRVVERAQGADVIVKAAAVGDYRPVSRKESKIKRGGEPTLTVELERNPDIVEEIGRNKGAHQTLVGFAAESEDLERNAAAKLAAKHLDLIAANRITGPDSAFGAGRNQVTLIGAGGVQGILEGTKEEVAQGIWDAVAGLRSRGD
ncbi:MAG: bifunctional phosphopantothenoylcysteine decarboxylase/phosphopantothenate--cysteine ligase CoaBC [Synergistales bacterium]|nr:bifunctional phosphopantothenoylcysteine decarboxylase/phosphopantothenate--cysteine ligase CoaBC [Synergistales bacterium]